MSGLPEGIRRVYSDADGLLMDKKNLPVGWTSNGIDRFVAIVETDPVIGGIGLTVGAASTAVAENFFTKTCGDVVAGSGALNGQTTDTGQVWQCGGAGYLSTVINPSGWIEGTQNTYCHIDTGKKIARAVQYYSGPMATIEIGLDSALTDMIHCNFTSGGSVALVYWRTGTVQWYQTVAACPNINDGMPHKLELHMAGPYAIAYADGVLLSIFFDTKFPIANGNWMFAQIHGAGERIYGVEAYASVENSDVVLPDTKVEVVAASGVTCKSITVGNPAGAGFVPSSSSYYWTESVNGHVFGGAGTATVRAKSDSPGYSGVLVAQAYIGTETSLVSGNDGVGSVQHQGVDKVKFPFNTARADWQVPITVPVYTVALLPSAAVAYQKVFVSDATTPAFGATVVGGGAVKVPVYSDGTNWKVG